MRHDASLFRVFGTVSTLLCYYSAKPKKVKEKPPIAQGNRI